MHIYNSKCSIREGNPIKCTLALGLIFYHMVSFMLTLCVLVLRIAQWFLSCLILRMFEFSLYFTSKIQHDIPFLILNYLPNEACVLMQVLQSMIQMGVLVPTGDMTAVKRIAQFFLNMYFIKPIQWECIKNQNTYIDLTVVFL